MKNYLVKFNCVIGDHEYLDYYIFNKKKSEWGYCKEFWSINKRDSSCLKKNMFWDNNMMNAISVDSETELSDAQAGTIQELGIA